MSRLYPAVDRDAGDFERREKLGAEPLRLRERAAREFAAADAGRKSEIIFDARTGARLPARRMPVEQQRSQPFRCAVHRRREAGRTGADDHEIVDIEGGGERLAEALGDLRAAPDCAAREPSSKNSAGSSSAPTPAASSSARASGIPRRHRASDKE